MSFGQLHSVQQLFSQRIFRVPDYQRGFAWEKDQIRDFWDDLDHLEEGKRHYTGLITVEPVTTEAARSWSEEAWLLEQRGYQPYYVIDGQQRLTTTLLLIQALLETLGPQDRISTLPPEAVREQYICVEGVDLARAFVFGYERDHASNEFLKTQIFGTKSGTDDGVRTLYTLNLQRALADFRKRVAPLTPQARDALFRKLTQGLQFNLFETGDEVEASVIFETMNYRGKKLSTLELLKNRLLHLSSLLVKEEDQSALRKTVNGCWRSIYAQLGRNPSSPLRDDEFLRAHYVATFEGARDHVGKFGDDLLRHRFTVNRLRAGEVTAQDLQGYALSAKAAAARWYLARNPFSEGGPPAPYRIWLDRLNRIGWGDFGPLVIALPIDAEEYDPDVEGVLREAERFRFLTSAVSRRKATAGRRALFKLAHDVHVGRVSPAEAAAQLRTYTNHYFNLRRFDSDLEEWFKRPQDKKPPIGFYAWPGLRYFLYEYELHLQQKVGGDKKLDWSAFRKSDKGFVTVEHVYPQRASKSCWTESFKSVGPDRQKRYAHSLGNLIPLSKRKNAQLAARCFEDKKAGGDGWPGYRVGSYNELEVASHDRWGPAQITQRGLKMLAFAEERWDVSLGSLKGKRRLLRVNKT